jgi:D-amino peptidase
MSRQIMIRCDLEGVTGVVSYDQAEPGKPEYSTGQRWFMGDLLAVIEGLRQGGADFVWIYDEHCSGRNVDLAALPDSCAVICGKPPYRGDWAGGLDGSFEGLVLLGFHSKYGTPGGLLHHSYELDIRDLRLNGVSVGEIGMEAAIAGDYGVAVLLVAGDSAGVAEAQALLPGVAGVTVKESISATGGACYPAVVTTARLRAAAAQVMRSRPAVRPLRFDSPVRLEVELNDGPYLDAVRSLFETELTDGRALVLSADSVPSVWADYWARKLRAQALAATR